MHYFSLEIRKVIRIHAEGDDFLYIYFLYIYFRFGFFYFIFNCGPTVFEKALQGTVNRAGVGK